MMEIIDATSGEVLAEETAIARHADRINGAWRETLDGVLNTGRLLSEAKIGLGGSFLKMVDERLSFGRRTAQRLMAIHASQRLRATHVSLLPTSWGTLHALTTLSDEEWQTGLDNKLIRSDMERSDINAIKALLRSEEADQAQSNIEGGCTADDLEALIKSGKRFGAIYADPPWSFTVYSGKGKARSADRHYPTQSLDWIKSLPVQQLAADDCALFLWGVMPDIPGALDVIKAWGFEYKTAAFTWVKQYSLENENIFWGMGYWTRANAENCFLATRGAPKRQATDVHQVIMAPVGAHSAKPDEAVARIERLVGGPYLELFARQARPNWTCWGNQISRNLFTKDIPEVA